MMVPSSLAAPVGRTGDRDSPVTCDGSAGKPAGEPALGAVGGLAVEEG
jgi:hypothetical protein